MNLDIANVSPVLTNLVIVMIGSAIILSLLQVIQKNFIKSLEDNASRYKANKFSNFLGYFFIMILIVIVYSDIFQGLGIFLGMAGAGIAFALQEVIASFAGWLVIMFGGFYKTGDRVQLGGIKGDVMDIGILRTTLMEIGQWVDGDLYNGRIVLIANSFVFKEPVFNYSGDFPFLWDELKIPVKYGSDYASVEKLLLDVSNDVVGKLQSDSTQQWKILQNKYRLEDARIDPVVFMAVNDNWVEYTLRYVVDYKKRKSTKSKLFSRILIEVEKSEGRIQFSSATFNLVGAPELKVNLSKESEI